MKSREEIIQKSIENSSYSLAGTVASFFIALFVAGFSIRILGEAIAGFVMLVQSMIGFGSSFSNLGLGAAVIKDISEAQVLNDHERIKKSISVTSFFNLGAAILVALIFCVLSIKIAQWSKLPSEFVKQGVLSVYIYSIAFVINSGLVSYHSIASALQRYDYANLFSTFQGFSAGIIQILVLIFCPSLLNLSLGYLMAVLLQTILILSMVHRLMGVVYIPKWDYNALKRLFNFSIVTFLMHQFYGLRDYADRWILTGLNGSAILPGYVVGQTLLIRIRSFISGPFHFVFPMVSASSQNLDRQKIFSMYDQLHWFVSFLGAVVFGLVALNGNWILNIWIGSDFASKYTYLLQLACLQGMFSCFSIIPHFISFGMNKPINNLIEAGVTTTLVLVLAILLIPRYGVLGAACSQLVAYVVVSVVIQLNMKRNVFYWMSSSRLIQPIIPGLMLGLILFCLSLYLDYTNFYLEVSLLKFGMQNIIAVLLAISFLCIESVLWRKMRRVQVLLYILSLLGDKIRGIVTP